MIIYRVSDYFSNFAQFSGKLQMIISKKRYLQSFCIIVVTLGVVRCIFPTIAGGELEEAPVADTMNVDVAGLVPAIPAGNAFERDAAVLFSKFFKADGSLVKNRIYSVPNFANAFPDQNDVQLYAASRCGVEPVEDRTEAECRKAKLVYVGSNPYFYVERLRSSIPYLVPRAAVLLQDIGRSYFDSLQTKGIPLHKIIVTSVMRSKADVGKLRNTNDNATQNSCHLYGTTFDICYNRYKTVENPNALVRRQVRNDTLKWVLSEVLNDMRINNRCLIKCEVRQGCFHITVN